MEIFSPGLLKKKVGGPSCKIADLKDLKQQMSEGQQEAMPSIIYTNWHVNVTSESEETQTKFQKSTWCIYKHM